MSNIRASFDAIATSKASLAGVTTAVEDEHGVRRRPPHGGKYMKLLHFAESSATMAGTFARFPSRQESFTACG